MVNPASAELASTPSWSAGGRRLSPATSSGVRGLEASTPARKEVDFGHVNPSAERSGIWKDAGVDAKAASGTWYREAGTGMGATINTAVGMGAYVFTDRATWSSFKNRGDYKIAVEGDKKLFNQYGIILVNPAKHPNVKKAEGQAFMDWVLSAEGQGAIKAFQINGEQQFFPNAGQGS